MLLSSLAFIYPDEFNTSGICFPLTQCDGKQVDLWPGWPHPEPFKAFPPFHASFKINMLVVNQVEFYYHLPNRHYPAASQLSIKASSEPHLDPSMSIFRISI
jgi:hypothetical protein